MQASDKFWNKIAPKYALSPIRDRAAYEHTRERTRSYLKPGDRVLELGCGTGSTALELAPSLGHVTGADISDGMIDIARGKARDQGIANADFVVAGAADPLPDERPYDVVLAHNLWHLVPATETAITKVYERVRPGGLFISKTPCLAQPGINWKVRLMLCAIPVMQMLGKAPYVRKFSIPELEAMITAPGFEIIETGNYPDNPPNRYIVARRPGI